MDKEQRGLCINVDGTPLAGDIFFCPTTPTLLHMYASAVMCLRACHTVIPLGHDINTSLSIPLACTQT